MARDDSAGAVIERLGKTAARKVVDHRFTSALVGLSGIVAGYVALRRHRSEKTLADPGEPQNGSEARVGSERPDMKESHAGSNEQFQPGFYTPARLRRVSSIARDFLDRMKMLEEKERSKRSAKGAKKSRKPRRGAGITEHAAHDLAIVEDDDVEMPFHED